MGFLIFGLFISLSLVGCSKKVDGESFVYTAEVTPSAPVLITPTSLPTYTTYSSNVKIVGCFIASCKSNSAGWTVSASGDGTLTFIDTHFTFETTMTIGETRVFSFNLTNSKGVVSPTTTLTVDYDAAFQLSPTGKLSEGGAGFSSPRTSNNTNYRLNHVSSGGGVTESQISSGGYVLTTGVLNQ
jgi:hypothetical protein